MLRIDLVATSLSLALAYGACADTPDESPRASFWTADNLVQAVEVVDDVLYLGGEFTSIGVHGGPFAILDSETSEPRLVVAGVENEVRAVASDGAGGWIIGGTFSRVGGIEHRFIARILADGSVSEWDPGINSVVEAILVDGSTVYVAGQFGAVAGKSRRRAAAVDLDTGALLPWDPDVNDTVFTLAKLDDTVYLGGPFTRVGGQDRNSIAAVAADSGALLSWNPGATPPAVWDIVPTQDAIYVGGNFDTISGQSRNRLAAIDPSTAAALPFDPSANSTVTALAVGGSSLYVGGVFTQIGGASRNRIAEIDLVSGMATLWDPNASGGDGTSTSIEEIVVSSRAIYACGSFSSIGGAARKHLAALDPITGAATPFGTEFDGASSTLLYDMELTGDEVAVGGKFSITASSPRARLAAIDLVTGQLLPWNPGSDGPVKALHRSGTTLYTGGAFTQVAGENRRFLAAFDTTTGELSDFDAQITTHTGFVAAIESFGATVFVGGAFQQFTGGTHGNLAALDSATGAVRPWDLDAGAPVYALGMHGPSETLFVGGGFAWLTSGQESRSHLGSFNAATGALLPFAPVVSRTVRSLAPGTLTLYVGGEFEAVNGFPRAHLAAFDVATGDLTSWAPVVSGGNSSRSPFDLKVHGNQVFVAGEFEFINGGFYPYLAALDPTNGTAAEWSPEPNRAVLSIAANGQVLAAGGEFLNMNGVPSGYLAVFDFPPFPLQTELTDFVVTFGTLINGDLRTLTASDNHGLQVRSQFGFSATEPNIVELSIGAASAFAAPTLFDISIEQRLNNPGGQASLRLMDWVAGEFEEIATYSTFQKDDLRVFSNVDAIDHVRISDRRVELRVRNAVIATFGAMGFDAFFDWVEISVE